MADKYFYSESLGWAILDENHTHPLLMSFIEKPESEYREFVKSLAIKSNEEKLEEFKVAVRSALDASDLVALRAYKSGIAFGDEWCAYDQKLRTLMSVTEWSDDLELPEKPATYPS